MTQVSGRSIRLSAILKSGDDTSVIEYEFSSQSGAEDRNFHSGGLGKTFTSSLINQQFLLLYLANKYQT